MIIFVSGIFFSNGEQWASSRKFVVKHMRAYGKNEKENIITDEINRFVERIKDTKSTQVNNVSIRFEKSNSNGFKNYILVYSELVGVRSFIK